MFCREAAGPLPGVVAAAPDGARPLNSRLIKSVSHLHQNDGGAFRGSESPRVISNSQIKSRS